MMDYIRQLRVAGRRSWTQAGMGGSSRPGPSPGGLRVDWVGAAGEARALEHDPELHHAGNRVHPAADGGLPAATVQSSASGNYLILATTPKFPVAGNDNSISFVTNDVGTYNQATASWYFRVTPNPGNGVGMSFALLNTANYGTSGGASTTL